MAAKDRHVCAGFDADHAFNVGALILIGFSSLKPINFQDPSIVYILLENQSTRIDKIISFIKSTLSYLIYVLLLSYQRSLFL